LAAPDDPQALQDICDRLGAGTSRTVVFEAPRHTRTCRRSPCPDRLSASTSPNSPWLTAPTHGRGFESRRPDRIKCLTCETPVMH
jgi:hypothetical protein